MALKQARLNKIMQLLQQQGSVTTVQLSNILGVTGMTIRRDLDILEQKGQISRTHGGAVWVVRNALIESPFPIRATENIEKKKHIAAHAAAALEDGQRLFIASGSTIDYFARGIDLSRRLSVVTNAVNVAYALCNHQNIKVFVLGGELRNNTFSTIGSFSENLLDNFAFDAAYVGVTGIDPEGKMYQSATAEVSLIQRVSSLSESTFILADSTKLGRTDFVFLERLKAGHTLITNADAPEAAVEAYRHLGATVELIP